MANGSFDGVVCKMREHLQSLKACELATPNKRENFPSGTLPEVKCEVAGVYCFYEGDKPLYVGRSRNIKKRVLQHRRERSGHNQAAFAFNIAKKEFGWDKATRYETRKELEDDPEFVHLFDAAKARVRKMSVRFVEIHDPIEQTIFEVYAHMELGTSPRFNSFDTH